jgi:hypothetical protein
MLLMVAYIYVYLPPAYAHLFVLMAYYVCLYYLCTLMVIYLSAYGLGY